MGFGMTTILLNLHNVGFSLWTVLFLPWAFSTAASRKFCWSAGVQKRQHFRFNRIHLYGSFWLTLVAILLMPKLGLTMRQMHSSLVSTWVCGAYLRVYVLRHAERRTRSAIRFL